MGLTFVIFVFCCFVSLPRVSAEEMTPEKLFAKVKKNTDKIKTLKAKITSEENGEILFTGNLFFKRPKLRIDFTGPEGFDGVGLSAIRDGQGVVTVDEEGYEIASTGAIFEGFFLNT